MHTETHVTADMMSDTSLTKNVVSFARGQERFFTFLEFQVL
jgi:hypothetical protein